MASFDPLAALTALLRRCPAITGGDDGSLVLDRSILPVTEREWGTFITLANAQGVGPLVAGTLLDNASVAPPPAVAEHLQSIQTAATQRALMHLAELLRVQARLRAEGVPMLFFKGQMLAQQAYGSINLRFCFDLDIFVKQTDVLRVKQLLGALGYVPEFPFQPHQEADLLRMECEYTFIRGDGVARIDLQWRPRARHFSFPVPAEALWARSQRVRLQGFEVDTFALDDLVLLLVSHGAKHTWNRLELASALAALLHRNPGLNWPEIERAARDVGAERMLLLAVHLVVGHFGAPVSAELAERAAADSDVVSLADECAAQWSAPPTPQPLLLNLRRHLRMRERVADRLRYCFWLAITPSPQDWLAHPFSPRWHWLHYLLRPWRLACKQARAGQNP